MPSDSASANSTEPGSYMPSTNPSSNNVNTSSTTSSNGHINIALIVSVSVVGTIVIVSILASIFFRQNRRKRTISRNGQIKFNLKKHHLSNYPIRPIGNGDHVDLGIAPFPGSRAGVDETQTQVAGDSLHKLGDDQQPETELRDDTSQPHYHPLDTRTRSTSPRLHWSFRITPGWGATVQEELHRSAVSQYT
ncbi:hypothetical protein BU15DRAFT_65604 [Melanogaster broomeanus]|nr:hypothetical protein BU15DRAFT_65604 [Melanogaster broomeanus]